MKIERFEVIDRCLYWKEKQILIIGDLHLGYEEGLNLEGINIPLVQIEETLKVLKKILLKCETLKEIILLGDVKHYFSGILNQEFSDFSNIIKELQKSLVNSGKIVIIRGNHDKILEPITRKFEFIEVRESYIIEDVEFLHGDFLEFKKLGLVNLDKKIKLVVVGHFHPAIILEEGIKQEKYKCFLYGECKEIEKEIIIIPSFFPLIEGSDIINEINWKININNFNLILLDESGDLYDFGKVCEIKRE